jgi:2-polyprenyl-6-methoxyphenol hydroxylase-like FAD-dependent oxidoreductase
MTHTRTALVIGGGIAGPVVAMALRQAGIEAAIYEAYAGPAEGVGGMLMVAPNGLDALRIIGADVSTIGQPIQRMVIAGGNGRRFGEFAGLRGLPPSRVLWRADLFRALHDHAVAQGIPIEYGKRLVGIDDTPTGAIARFADGSAASGDVVIGADGIRSTVRTLIDPSAPDPAYVGHLGFGGTATDCDVPAELGAMHFVFGRRAFLGYWTQPDGRIPWFSNLPHREPLTIAEARAVPAAEWLRRLREVHADDVPGRDLLRHTTAERLFFAGAGETLAKVPHWHRGRMVLVGDSAHAPSSSSGQGASLAAESAIELARCLRDLPDGPAAFAAYEGLRRHRVEKVAAYAARQNNNKVSGPVAKALMGFLMPIAMKTFLKPERMLGWMHGYRIDWDDVVTP